ncbi:hypothetical protein IKX12_00320 [Candidatus Saccharibacteria bacterium]|nr:hypothetical protein [Candidatus Saccharibacteria bacterium]
MRAKNRIVYAFVYGKTPAVGFDSPFADERIRCGLSRINKNLFPNDCKIEYPYKRQYDIDVKEVYRAININVCEYIIRWIKDSAEEFDLPDLVKKYKLAVKALRAEINRLEEVELLSETDYGCTGRSDL